MGERAGDDARPLGGEAAEVTADEQLGEIRRIAGSVRDVVHARAAGISRVVDDEWLEVVAMAGTPSVGEVAGMRWRRSELDRLLETAHELGRLHVTRQRGISYAEVPEDEPTADDTHQGFLIAPLHTANGDLVGVLSTEGPVDLAHPDPAACELVELYAGQARLALLHLREHHVLVDELRRALELRQRDQDLVEELRALDQYRRDLVASITHDLKTPLTAIALNTELLESDRRLDDAGSHPVAAIRRSAERLSNLVDDLLALAKAEETPGAASDVDLVGLVHEACQHLETEAALRGVRFSLEAPDELRVSVDVGVLARVVANLIANAVKFSLPRGTVLLHLTRSGDLVELRCTDEGIGIQEERLASLFDVSRRSPDARTEDVPGSGIGLAISQRIVARLGGEITVESAPGRGSTFTVRLPVAPPSR